MTQDTPPDIETVDQEPPPSAAAPSLARNRDYLLLVSGQAVSMLGNYVSLIAVPVLVLALTGSPTQAGLVGAFEALPYLLFGLVAGALVDRWNRKTVMLVCDGVRALAMLTVPAAYAFGSLEVGQLYAVAFVVGSAFVFFNIAELSSLTSIVSKSQLTRATSVNSMVETTGGLVGPGLGGVLVSVGRTTLVGGVIAFLVDAITFAVSFVSLLFIRRPFQGERSTESRRRLVAEIKEGFGFLWRHPLMRPIALVSAALNLVFSPAYLALIVLVRDQGGNTAQIGLVFSIGSAGGLLGALSVPWLTRRMTAGRLLVTSTTTWALAMALLPLSVSPYMTAMSWGLVTFLSPMYDVTQMSYRLSVIPEELQGRVNSAFRFLAWGLRPLALGVGGAAVGAFGAREVLVVLAAGMVLIAVAVGSSRLREARIETDAIA